MSQLDPLHPKNISKSGVDTIAEGSPASSPPHMPLMLPYLPPPQDLHAALSPSPTRSLPLELGLGMGLQIWIVECLMPRLRANFSTAPSTCAHVHV